MLQSHPRMPPAQPHSQRSPHFHHANPHVTLRPRVLQVGVLLTGVCCKVGVLQVFAAKLVCHRWQAAAALVAEGGVAGWGEVVSRDTGCC